MPIVNVSIIITFSYLMNSVLYEEQNLKGLRYTFNDQIQCLDAMLKVIYT